MNVLITGQNGYIAKVLHAHLTKNRHDVHLLNVRQNAWQHVSFDGADSIVHLAGIVHNSSSDPSEYQRVNVELTAALARKARDENVPQFVLASSMAVFGKNDIFAPLNEINAQTRPLPQTLYGKSKLSAERELLEIYENCACIIRPPMVYGENCTGNYRKLRELVLRLKFVPRYDNCRGMIYVHNLCEYLRLLIENSGAGIFHPQDKDFLPTYEISRIIGEENDVNVRTLRVPFLDLGAMVLPELKKAFGSLSYSPELTECPFGEYRLYDTRSAVVQTEKYWNT